MHERSTALSLLATMTGHTTRFHDTALPGDALETEVTSPLEDPQEEGNRLCKKCAALTYQRMRASEMSPEGQIHHDSWTSLVEAANRGCRLCTFFTEAALHPKSRPGRAFYSDENGPIRLKIVETWKDRVVCLHMYVLQDKHPAVYYLYVTAGSSLDVCVPCPNLRRCRPPRPNTAMRDQDG